MMGLNPWMEKDKITTRINPNKTVGFEGSQSPGDTGVSGRQTSVFGGP